MPAQRLIVADLEMAQAQFALFVLQATFDRPAGEPHVQKNFQRNPADAFDRKYFSSVGFSTLRAWISHHGPCTFPSHLCQTGIIRTSQTIGPFPVSLMRKRIHG